MKKYAFGILLALAVVFSGLSAPVEAQTVKSNADLIKLIDLLVSVGYIPKDRAEIIKTVLSQTAGDSDASEEETDNESDGSRVVLNSQFIEDLPGGGVEVEYTITADKLFNRLAIEPMCPTEYIDFGLKGGGECGEVTIYNPATTTKHSFNATWKLLRGTKETVGLLVTAYLGNEKIGASKDAMTVYGAATNTKVEARAELIETSAVVFTDKADSDTGDFSVKFNITAIGGDIYLANNAASEEKARAGGVEIAIDGKMKSSNAIMSSTAAESSDGYFVIRNGETKIFDVRIIAEPSMNGIMRAVVKRIAYNTSEAMMRGDVKYLNVNFRTPALNLRALGNTDEVKEKSVIKVISPNGGEKYGSKDLIPVTFTTNDSIGPFSIYLVGEKGVAASAIASKAMDLNGSNKVELDLFTNKLGTINAGQYKIKVCDEGTDIKNPVCDESNRYITIAESTTSTTNSFRLSSPEKGEVISAGQTVRIAWSAPDLQVATNPTIDLINGDETEFIMQIGSGSQANGNYSKRTYEWTVPRLEPGIYRIRITNDGAGNIKDSTVLIQVVETSNAQSAKSSIVVNSPNGGERYKNTDLIPVTFTTNDSIGPFSIYLVGEKGVVASTIASKAMELNGSNKVEFDLYTSKLNTIPGGQYKIKVCDEGTDVKNPVCDESNRYIYITTTSSSNQGASIFEQANIITAFLSWFW